MGAHCHISLSSAGLVIVGAGVYRSGAPATEEQAESNGRSDSAPLSQGRRDRLVESVRETLSPGSYRTIG